VILIKIVIFITQSIAPETTSKQTEPVKEVVEELTVITERK